MLQVALQPLREVASGFAFSFRALHISSHFLFKGVAFSTDCQENDRIDCMAINPSFSCAVLSVHVIFHDKC